MSKSPNIAPDSSFLMVGDDPSLDFLNTVLAGSDGQPRELLDSPEALYAWSAASKLFDAGTLNRMRAAWRSPKAGNSALARARTLRAELADLVQRVIDGKTYVQHAAALLSPYLSALPLQREAVVENGHLDTRLRPDDSTNPADAFLGTLASSTLSLLVQAKPEHIRKCANLLCVVVFHDKTKNHRRQWCSMDVCGNRAKAERFREKHHH